MIFFSPASLESCPFLSSVLPALPRTTQQRTEEASMGWGMPGEPGCSRAPPCWTPLLTGVPQGVAGPMWPLSPWGAQHIPLLCYLPHLPHSLELFPVYFEL